MVVAALVSDEDENRLPRSLVIADFRAVTPCSIFSSTLAAVAFMVSVALDKVDAGGNGDCGNASSNGGS